MSMKINIALFIIASVLVSCATPKTIKDSKKVMKGDWVLNTVTYDQDGDYRISLLGDQSKDCFEGSTWRFIPNNNTGTYSIEAAGCDVGARNFVFSIQEIDATTGYYDFLLKPTDERGKSETNRGFRMRLSQLSETTMTWQQYLTVDGKPFTLNMNFTKY